MIIFIVEIIGGRKSTKEDRDFLYSPTPRAEPKKRKVAPFTMSAAESKLIVSRPRSRRRSIGDDQEEQKSLAAVGEEEEVEEEQERPDYTAQTRHMGKCNTFSIVVYLYLFTGRKYGRKDRSRSPSPGGGAGRFGFGRRNTTGSTGERDAQGKRGKGSLVGAAERKDHPQQSFQKSVGGLDSDHLGRCADGW